MYAHLASNDTTGPLNFLDPTGWLLGATVAPLPGSYAGHGFDGASPWIDIATDAGLVRLVGTAWKLRQGAPPPDDPGTIYFAVWPDSYLEVAANEIVDRVFFHTHQASFDNVHGDGTKPTVAEVIGRRPVDLLGPTVKQRIDGTSLGDAIVLGDWGGSVYANDGADTVFGGARDDLIYGGNGGDALFGQGGEDELRGENGNDTIDGGADDDTLYGGADKDTLHGGDGQDRLHGDWQDDRLYGEADRDWLYGGDNDDVLYGGAGEDDLYGGNDKDTLDGGIDNDRLYGEAGNDWLYGGIGQDELYGGAGKDRLYGGIDNDPLHGGKGNDKLHGEVGQDSLYGGAGKDQLHGGDDNDWLYGDKGNDRLFGDIANDFLYGGGGKDRLDGGQDNDRLDGGAGKDVLTGGIGADTFVFSTKLARGNVDRIADFEVGTDGIWLSRAVFGKLPEGPLDASAFHRGTAADDRSDRIVYNPKKGVLIYDHNGDKGGGAQVFAKVDKGLPLSNGDFFVI